MTLSDSDQALRHRLRQQARAARRSVDAELRERAGEALAGALSESTRWQRARRVGAYLAVASEISVASVIERALGEGRELYLPLIQHAQQPMGFARWRGDPRNLHPNLFGIPEPMVELGDIVAADQLDLLLLPLVAFDRHGQRLGSGAGYYDRALAFRLESAAPPWLVGVGFACQEVDPIPAEAWDVPLDAVLTERGLRPFAGRGGQGESSPDLP